MFNVQLLPSADPKGELSGLPPYVDGKIVVMEK
jgi:hypothetical protein